MIDSLFDIIVTVIQKKIILKYFKIIFFIF